MTSMLEVLQSATFEKWFKGLKDAQARARIDARIRRLSLGNPGDAKALRDGVSELRIDTGPGYRVYFTQRGALVVLLLCGGDKSTQDRDIERAINLAKEWTLWR
jgi:putative addiction module killer protein